MNKKVLTAGLIFLLTVNAAISFGQSLQLADSSGVLAEGATVSILRSPVASSEIPCVLFVKNLTNSPIDVGVFRTTLEVVNNTDNYFCWGACYPPFVDTGSISVTIPKSKWDSSFIAHYSYENPAGVFNQGTSKIRYTFYDTQNPATSVSVTVNYVCGTAGMNDPGRKELLSAPFPNPADLSASLAYELPPSALSATISVRNLLGVEVSNLSLEKGQSKTVLNTTGLPSGIYVYSLVIDGKVSFTRKLIVRH